MSDIIDGAVKLIRENGWTKEEFHTADGYCLVGALRYSALNLFRDEHGRFIAASMDREALIEEAMVAVFDVLKLTHRAFTSHHVADITYWNDIQAQDVDDVLHVLKLAGERLDGR